jgi:arginase
MKIKLIKNRSDIGAGTRGSDLGIDAIEIAAINASNDYFNRHLYEDVETHNETIYNKNTNDFAKRIEHVFEQCERVATSVQKNLQENYFPIVLSGDHSSALGTISGIKAAYPNKKLGVVWIDAHADIHSPYTSPSGNIHGMPLAAALGIDNLDSQINEPSPETLRFWNKLKNIGIPQSKIDPSHLIYFGIRDYEAAEQAIINKLGIQYYTVEQVRSSTIPTCIQETINKLQTCDLLYISFDVDSMDCDRISYGTGTPVPSGLYPEEIMQIIDLLILSKKVKCVEFTEINPLLDNKGNKMAETAFTVLDHISQAIEKSKSEE